MNQLSNLASGLIGAVVGAVIGAIVSFIVAMWTMAEARVQSNLAIESNKTIAIQQAELQISLDALSQRRAQPTLSLLRSRATSPHTLQATLQNSGDLGFIADWTKKGKPCAVRSLGARSLPNLHSQLQQLRRMMLVRC